MKQATEDEKKLTLKQRKWLDLYLETGNATEAAMQAYDCKDRYTARNVGSQNVAKLGIDSLMDEMGLSDKHLITKLAEGLEAKRVVAARIIMQGGKQDAATSQTDDFIDVDDYATRHRYLETALKLKKRLGSEQTVNNVNVQNNQFVVYDGGEPSYGQRATNTD